MAEANLYNQTVKNRQDKEKQTLINILKEMPVITVAVKRLGISRDTYYRWKTEDNDFLRQSSAAIKEGIEFINDMGDAKIIQLINEGKLPAIALWLKHNSQRYGAKAMPRATDPSIADLTPKEKRFFDKALALSSGKIIKSKNKLCQKESA